MNILRQVGYADVFSQQPYERVLNAPMTPLQNSVKIVGAAVSLSAAQSHELLPPDVYTMLQNGACLT
jgi:regulator of RNase E activity RraA